MKLNDATEADISHLMSWFPTARSVCIWGDPKFRYPFTAETFFEDVRWQQIDSYQLVDLTGDMLALGRFTSVTDASISPDLSCLRTDADRVLASSLSHC